MHTFWHENEQKLANLQTILSFNEIENFPTLVLSCGKPNLKLNKDLHKISWNLHFYKEKHYYKDRFECFSLKFHQKIPKMKN